MDLHLNVAAVRTAPEQGLDQQLQGLLGQRRNPAVPPLNPLQAIAALNLCLCPHRVAAAAVGGVAAACACQQFDPANPLGNCAEEFTEELLRHLELQVQPNYVVNHLETGVCQLCQQPSMQVQ